MQLVAQDRISNLISSVTTYIQRCLALLHYSCVGISWKTFCTGCK